MDSRDIAKRKLFKDQLTAKIECLDLCHEEENLNLKDKKFELFSRVNTSINHSRKLLLTSRVEEFFNKCHDNGGRFCEGNGTPLSSKKRTWIDKPGKQQMVIMYHHATRAGPHIDVHIGDLSLIYRVKPDLQDKLKFNSNGVLTADSKNQILDHVKSEIQNKSRVPQNLDHSLNEARQSWLKGNPNDKSYGAGKTRQVVDESTVNVYKATKDGPIEFYAPALNPDKGMYVYKLHPGDEKRVPILIWGNKTARPPKFEDRLHLKSKSPEEVDKLDDMHTTVKYDGASAYISIGPKGTTVWSPRTSKKTGEQIEYTPKLGEISGIKSPETITGMGEILFSKKGKKGYLSVAEIGGALNAHKLLPDNLQYEIRLYRIDRVGRKSTKELPFLENRTFQEKVAKLSPKYFKVVEMMHSTDTKKHGHEGVVGVPKGKSVNEGVKLKWRSDANDWEIKSVNFKPGDKGGLAGVTHLKSLDSGKEYKLGPGQMGNHTLVKHMMENPKDYVGVVVKVHSHHGYEGRSSKVLGFHMDKGVVIPEISKKLSETLKYL